MDSWTEHALLAVNLAEDLDDSGILGVLVHPDVVAMAGPEIDRLCCIYNVEIASEGALCGKHFVPTLRETMEELEFGLGDSDREPLAIHLHAAPLESLARSLASYSSGDELSVGGRLSSFLRKLVNGSRPRTLLPEDPANVDTLASFTGFQHETN